jgi:hypothetical protein
VGRSPGEHSDEGVVVVGQVAGGGSGEDDGGVLLGVALELLKTGYLCFVTVFVLDGDGRALLFDDPDCAAEVEVEGDLGCCEDVVSSNDEYFVLCLLQLLYVLDSVLLEGRVANKESNKIQLILTVMSLKIFIVELSVMLVIYLFRCHRQQPVSLFGVESVSFLIGWRHRGQQFFDSFRGSLHQTLHLSCSSLRNVLGHTAHAFEFSLEGIHFLDDYLLQHESGLPVLGGVLPLRVLEEHEFYGISTEFLVY